MRSAPMIHAAVLRGFSAVSSFPASVFGDSHFGNRRPAAKRTLQASPGSSSRTAIKRLNIRPMLREKRVDWNGTAGLLSRDAELADGRGRDEDFSSPPAQIPACAANAPGSSLGSDVVR
jgi:hypothetical protein